MKVFFAVTANHVIEGWKRDCVSSDVVAFQLGHDLQIDFDGQHGFIAAHEGIDIATFRISEREIASIGKTPLTGYHRSWPPLPPKLDRGIYFGGFPGVETIKLSRNEISFGATAGGGVASSISEKDVSSLIERINLIPVLGRGLPPENFDFGGISGGPMLTVVEQNGLRSWSLAGVIHEGPNPAPDAAQAINGLEVIKARRAHFILPDGTPRRRAMGRTRTLKRHPARLPRQKRIPVILVTITVVGQAVRILRRAGHVVARKQVRRLMAKIGMMRIYKKQGPRTHLRNAGNASNCRRT